MSIQETYKWAKEKMSLWEEVPLSKKDDHPQKIDTPQNHQFKNDSFFGDVVLNNGDIFFHFFPTPNDRYNLIVDSPALSYQQSVKTWSFNSTFIESLTEAFFQVFKHEDRLFIDFILELQSYVIRCAGFGSNPLYMDMCDAVLLRIKNSYER